MLVIIAAIGQNNELGKDNQLIWYLPGDLKFFKEKTLNHSIVMGRRTFESLPKLLPQREHIVISRNKDLKIEGVKIYSSIEDFFVDHQFDEEVFVIGGASIYKSFLPHTNKMYLTHIEAKDAAADVFFPQFNPSEWSKEELSQQEENGIQYRHTLYLRK